MIEFTVFGQPQPGGSKRAFRTKTGQIVVTDANPKAQPWKTLVAQEAGEVMEGREVLRGPLSVRFAFYFRRPKGHYGKKGLLPSAPAYPASRPDCLKAARAVEDALSGVVYRDDAQIVHEVLEKHYGTERVEITIRPLEAQVNELPIAEQMTLVAEMRRA
jgi:Holliday junction resolvase RusA-like endonuclease